jgi:hypothetical protein
MEKDAREALQATKEIIVKFIETSRVSPGNFADVFPAVYQVVLDTIAGRDPDPAAKTPTAPARER